MAIRTKQHEAAKLEAGYTADHRVYEIIGALVAICLSVWLLVLVNESSVALGWWIPVAALVGALLSDFFSGFVHWLFDTWGGLDTPAVGPLVIRNFRHHHVDEKAITRHDFIETNAHPTAVTVIYSVAGLGIVGLSDASSFVATFLGEMLLFATVCVAMTNQIHKWAHTDDPPALVALLQRLGLLLGPKHHAFHHAAPYNCNYCITFGWMDAPLQALGFFRNLERLITATTGALPRVDDIGEDAAVAVACEAGVIVKSPTDGAEPGVNSLAGEG